jgi:nitrite reductase/ring-hydroxylating ferredoxin subunit
MLTRDDPCGLVRSDVDRVPSGAVVKLDEDEILRRLERHGLIHRSVEMETEGEYLPTDVDWNNKDVPHRNHVHSLIDDVSFVTEPDLQAAVSLQTIAGMRMPVVLVHYDVDATHQTHVVTLLAWTMVTTHEFVRLSPTRTRAVTRYTIAGNRFWMLFFPLIRLLLRLNYRKLMSEDIPMRERRGQLRSWGYTFVEDDRPRDIRRSLRVDLDNVLIPGGEVPMPTAVPVSALSADRWTDVGRSDHFGLRLRLEGRRVVAYPRLCRHDGADLSQVEPTGDCVVCPWHGRRWQPVARLDLDEGEALSSTAWHELSLRDGVVTITYRAAEPAEAPTGTEQP